MISEFLLVLRIVFSYKTILHVALPKQMLRKTAHKKIDCFELFSEIEQDTERIDKSLHYMALS